MKAKVDADLCVGCGLCVETCPAVFEMKDSLAVAKAAGVPADAEAACRDAADGCPVKAITIEP